VLKLTLLLQTFRQERLAGARDKRERQAPETLEGCHPGRLTQASFAGEKREFKAPGILTRLSKVPV